MKLALHLELDLMGVLRDKAEEEAIQVFARNLKDLLLAAPAGSRTTLGLDPGIRTGVKVAVVDATGKLVETATIYPFQPRNDVSGSRAALLALIAKHKVGLIAIGNGTASRETDKLAGDVLADIPAAQRPVKVIVNEAGASVYSASELAAKEMPDVDVSLRGAAPSLAACRTRLPNWSRSNRSPSASASTSTTSTRPSWPVRWMRLSKSGECRRR